MSKFKILWIDDQPDKIGLEKDTIENIVRQKGFEPIIDVISKISKSDVTKKAEWFSRLTSREYDILFIDYNLCNHILGSNIISDIRQNNDIYIDIVFYSSDRDSLLDAVKKSFDKSLMCFIDDVHIAILDDAEFFDKIEKTIDKIIGSWYNAHSIRGIILAKASKFETMVNEVIRTYYSSLSNDLVELLKRKNETSVSQIQKDWDIMLRSTDPTVYVLEHPQQFNWSVRRILFEKLVENNIINLENREFKQYLYEIFDLRNDFAHNKAKIENGKIILHKKSRDIIYNEENIKEWRERINLVEQELNHLLR